MEVPVALSVVLAMVLGGALLLWVQHCSLGWLGASRSGARLPKGSLGWPIVGETLDFAKNPVTFAASRVQRYGNIYKTSVFLQPVIMGTTPDFAKFVLSNSNLFASGWPTNVSSILGPKAFMFHDGQSHVSIKKIVQRAFLPEVLRTKIKILETIILENLVSWEQRGTVNSFDEARKIALDAGMWLLLGVQDIASTPEGKQGLENFKKLSRALVAPPVNIPGMAYNKALKAKSELTEYFKYLVEGRKDKDNTGDDVLGILLAAREDEEARKEVKDLDLDTIADTLVLGWFGSFDSISTTLTWILKLIVDHPEVFRRLQAEQQEILQSKDPNIEGPRLTWEDTRKMVYAHKFFQEVQRYLSIVPMAPKKATEDLEYDGYLIPKGWAVWAMYNTIHNDPSIYPDPKSFNPNRFDATPKLYTYLPFSSGTHLCPGIETAKLIVFIFVHHITTTFTYESAAPDKGIEYITFPMLTGGYPINIRRRE